MRTHPAADFLSAAFLIFISVISPSPRGVRAEPVKLPEFFTSFSDFPSFASWEKTVPQVKTVRIRSSADGSMQPALFYDSGSGSPKPLLVALHSWSRDYRQKTSIPYGLWCVENDWVFIHPDYRGVFDNPDATNSEPALRDVLDAVDYAKKNARIDDSRIYLIGFSGGAMTALIMAGRHPEVWTAVSAWVPIFNLPDWYRYNAAKFPDRHYAKHIISAFGGIPAAGSAAEKECNRRSPSSYLKNAKGRRLRIYIGHGIEDDYAPPGNAFETFNELADPADRIHRKDIESIDRTGKLPPHLSGAFEDPMYLKAGKPLLFRKTSGNATLSLFKGGHDVLYNVALYWLSQQTGRGALSSLGE